MTKKESNFERNRKYWEKRQRQFVKSMDLKDNRLEKELIKAYEKTSINCLEKISIFYAKYGQDNIIEYKQLLKKLDAKELRMLIRDVEGFMQEHPQYKHLTDVRKNIYKLNRLEGLKLSVELEQLKLTDIERNIITQHLEQAYSFSYNYTLETLGYGVNFNAINSPLMEATLNRAWANNVTYLQRIADNRLKISRWLEQDLVLHLARGETYNNIAKTFSNKFEGASIRDSRRIIRTEGTYLMNEAQAQVLEGEKFEEYVYNAILDKRTTQVCRALNGEQFKFKERQPGANFPPMHPNCRSTFDIVIPTDYLLKEYAKK